MSFYSEQEIFSRRCFCGAVNWRGTGPTIWAEYCHRDVCRCACSAVLSNWICLPRQPFTWDEAVQFYHSSAEVEQGFCCQCGLQMCYENAQRPEEMVLYAVSLDRPEQFVSRAHYHYAEWQNWYIVNGGLVKYCDENDTAADGI